MPTKNYFFFKNQLSDLLSGTMLWRTVTDRDLELLVGNYVTYSTYTIKRNLCQIISLVVGEDEDVYVFGLHFYIKKNVLRKDEVMVADDDEKSYVIFKASQVTHKAHVLTRDDFDTKRAIYVKHKYQVWCQYKYNERANKRTITTQFSHYSPREMFLEQFTPYYELP